MARVMEDAANKTRRALLNNSELRALFNPTFLTRLPILDELVPGLLQPQPESPSWRAWKQRMTETLLSHGYRENSFEAYAEIVEVNRPFLERHSYLFNSNSKH